MSDFRISIPGGEARRLRTGGMYCPSDIVVEATGGSGSDLPDAEAKAFGMQTVDYGASWLKTGYQGENGYRSYPNITEEMTNGHPYLILMSYDSDDGYVDEIVATASPMYLNPNEGLFTAQPADHFFYRADYSSGTWQMRDVMENYGYGIPIELMYWSNYDIQMAAEFGGGESGWIGYEPIKMEGIDNGEFTPADSRYQITGEMMNRLAAELQRKTGYQDMLTPEQMLRRIAALNMFSFESSADGKVLT